MKSYRHIIASIFLMIFSFIQLADLHVLDHDSGDTDCQICLLASEKHNDGFLNAEVVEIPCIITVPANVVRINYEQHYFDSTINYSLLNKAPPTA